MQRILTLLLTLAITHISYSQCGPDLSSVSIEANNSYEACPNVGFFESYVSVEHFDTNTVDYLEVSYYDGANFITKSNIGKRFFWFVPNSVAAYVGKTITMDLHTISGCGKSDTKATTTFNVTSMPQFKDMACASDYQTQIEGTKLAVRPQAGTGLFYLLDSPELRAYQQASGLNFEYYDWVVSNLDNPAQTQTYSGSDTTLYLDSIPYNRTLIECYLIEGTNCSCEQTSGPPILLDTIHAFIVDPSSTLNTIQGNVKYTEETDCSRQKNAAKVLMKLSGSFGTQHVYTDEIGNYEFIVSGTGSGAVEVANKDFVQNMCSGQTAKRNFTFNTTDQTKTENFAFIADANMNITSVGRAQMQRFSDGYKQQISIQNLGKPLQGNLVWSTPNKGSAGKEQINGSTGKPSSSNSTTQVLWTNVSIGFNQSLSFDITAQMNSNAVPGEYVASTIKFITASETFEFETGVEIRNSYDPNDKQVSHRNITPDVAANNPPTLLYHIRFQNTGNDTAYNIRIVDTLDQLLDLNTLAIGNSSHNVITDINFEERIVTWQFNNIMLPDSSTDLEGSQGYINMFVKPQKGLGEGRFIDNYVDIFFDLNPPVRTNTARTTISSTSSIAQLKGIPELKLWPNPNKGKFYLENSGGYTEVLIYSLDGKLMHQQKLLPSKEVDASGLAKGTYLVQVQGGAKAPAISRVLVE